MSKLVKSLLILFIIFSISIFVNFAYAIDLNLTETINGTNSSYVDENEVENDLSSNFSSSNSSSTIEDTTSSTRVSTVSNLPESNLGLSNILNILLIAVGIILIFLGIAILIKLNK